jgi:MFS family permease
MKLGPPGLPPTATGAYHAASPTIRRLEQTESGVFDRPIMHGTSIQPGSGDDGVTLLWAPLAVTFLASLGTGIFWNAIAFIARNTYHFPQERNFVLAAVMGAIYVIGALGIGRIMHRFDRRLRPRTLLIWLMIIQGLLCFGPVAIARETMFWITAAGVSLASAIMWPLLESYLSAGRHGRAMRSAIGWFNITWMSAVIIPLLAMPPLLEDHGQWVIGAQAIANLLALIPLCFFAGRPRHHAADLAAASVTEEYPLLLRSARVLLPMSCLLFMAMGPILPYRFEAIGVRLEFQTPATAVWMFARFIAMLIMYRLGFWHGRWGTLLLAASLMTGGFGLVVLAPDLAWMLIGFVFFGVGIGAVYYAALYYAMAVGRAEVAASGVHEALIGGGYTIGPLAGLAGTVLAKGTGLGRTVTAGQAIVGLVWALVALGAIGAAAPYLHARRLRRQSAKGDR